MIRFLRPVPATRGAMRDALVRRVPSLSRSADTTDEIWPAWNAELMTTDQQKRLLAAARSDRNDPG